MIGQTAPTDPVEQFLEPVKDLQRRVADLERAISRARLTLTELDARYVAVESKRHVMYSPGGNQDATATPGMVTWLTTGSFTVPAWATAARCNASMMGVIETGSTNTYECQLLVGTDIGRKFYTSGQGAVGGRFGFAWNDVVTLTSTGLKAVALQVSRIAGGGIFRADVSTDLVVILDFI